MAGREGELDLVIRADETISTLSKSGNLSLSQGAFFSFRCLYGMRLTSLQ